MAFPPAVRGVWRTRMSAPLPVRQLTLTSIEHISKLLVQQCDDGKRLKKQMLEFPFPSVLFIEHRMILA